jgi:hypothetical protein
MMPNPRIAIVWQSATPWVALRDDIATLEGQPTVHVFVDPVGEIERLRRLRPQVLLFGHDAPDAEHAGMLRMLRAALGDCGLVLATGAERTGDLQALAQRADARLLDLPASRAAVATAIGQAMQSPVRDGAQALLGLTRGLCDEVNNPLLAALGQLRLLAIELEGDSGKLGKLRAAEASLRRIEITVARARQVQRASELRALVLQVDLGVLVNELVPCARCPSAMIRGDRELLTLALRDLDHVARDLAGVGEPPRYGLDHTASEIVLRIALRAAKVADWQLPRTFEPYYLGRLLRGTSHGLALFAVQQIVAAHGGQAQAVRQNDGIAFELTFPAGERG